MNDRFRFRCFDNDIQKFVVGFRLCDNYNWPNGIIEQCTGLKDKNGELIYEGDIVDIFNWQHNKSQKGIVKYADNDACFGIFVSKMCYIAFSNIDEEYIEVIGNIHENPEMLEVEKC